MAIILDGDVLAQKLRTALSDRVKVLRQAGVTPQLVTILVGENTASAAYVARKHSDCQEVGIASQEIRLPDTCTSAQLSAEIAKLNADPTVHGFLVQLPLPSHLKEAYHLAEVSPLKDIDGLHPSNLGALLAARPNVLPCTPAAVLTLLKHHGIAISGQRVAIIGRGNLVGRPLAMLLSMRGIDATVLLAHRQTSNLAEVLLQANVVISAAGQPDLVSAQMIQPGTAVVGVGISYDTHGKMVSDIAADVAMKASHVTPHHGSVGALTRAMLLQNLLDFAEGKSCPR